MREPCQAGENGAVSGRQRKHGRKPAASAAAAVGQNVTFLPCAGRTGQTAGGTDNGKPGLRADYGENYYAAFVTDPDGNRLEAYCGRKE